MTNRESARKAFYHALANVIERAPDQLQEELYDSIQEYRKNLKLMVSGEPLGLAKVFEVLEDALYTVPMGREMEAEENWNKCYFSVDYPIMAAYTKA